MKSDHSYPALKQMMKQNCFDRKINSITVMIDACMFQYNTPQTSVAYTKSPSLSRGKIVHPKCTPYLQRFLLEDMFFMMIRQTMSAVLKHMARLLPDCLIAAPNIVPPRRCAHVLLTRYISRLCYQYLLAFIIVSMPEKPEITTGLKWKVPIP